MKHRKRARHEKKEAQDAQWFILKLIGSHLEQMAVHELKINDVNSKTSIDLWNYYKLWNEELEQLYKQNSLYIKMANMIKLKRQNDKNRQNFKKRRKEHGMKYEIWYSAIDGDYYKTSDTLEEANNDFAFVLTMYRLVPLFEMRLIEINTQGEYKVIKSFKNMKANNKDIVMAKAYYNSRTRKGE